MDCELTFRNLFLQVIQDRKTELFKSSDYCSEQATNPDLTGRVSNGQSLYDDCKSKSYEVDIKIFKFNYSMFEIILDFMIEKVAFLDLLLEQQANNNGGCVRTDEDIRDETATIIFAVGISSIIMQMTVKLEMENEFTLENGCFTLGS